MIKILSGKTDYAMKDNHDRFNNLTFDDFKTLAEDQTLSKYEKVGFPIAYREGKEDLIFKDICLKLTKLSSLNGNILEIGPGCSDLPIMLANLCLENNATIYFVDSAEMLANLPTHKRAIKIPGQFPDVFIGEKGGNKFDVILAYSVIQYAFAEGNFWSFLEKCLALLNPGGQILFGDIPNSSMRQRFLSSQEGKSFLKNFKLSNPAQSVNPPEIRSIDDSVIFSILTRVRDMGFHAWVLPQMAGLPMSNRREDILIEKPL